MIMVVPASVNLVYPSRAEHVCIPSLHTALDFNQCSSARILIS